ncbi:MAG: DUF438 domain-containing protein [Elusimicrobiota bacterium]
MSEIIDNSRMRKETLKHLILQLHKGEAPEAVKKQIARLMGQVPHSLIVEVEQELISEGMPAAEIQELCDIHSAALKGLIDAGGPKDVPEGHPVHTFRQENRALEKEIAALKELFVEASKAADDAPIAGLADRMLGRFNALMDVDKHYRRKENLLFPFLEKRGITGPSTVMWGKDDEARGLLKAALEALREAKAGDAGGLKSVAGLALEPAVAAVEEMIFKEENILLPMSLDALTTVEWYEIQRQSPEFGHCIYVPEVEWRPEEAGEAEDKKDGREGIRFPTGRMSVEELTNVLEALPFDLTFVDKDDRVGFFSHGKDRIFSRTKAILGRKVQHCHPPASVDVVERIIADFKSGKEDRAPFWIELKGRFVHIEYFAVRDGKGAYLGTLEVSQNLTELRKLEGEQRLLAYGKKRG